MREYLQDLYQSFDSLFFKVFYIVLFITSILDLIFANTTFEVVQGLAMLGNTGLYVCALWKRSPVLMFIVCLIQIATGLSFYFK